MLLSTSVFIQIYMVYVTNYPQITNSLITDGFMNPLLLYFSYFLILSS